MEKGGRAEAISARAARAIEFARHGRGDEGLFGGAGGSREKSRAGLDHAARWLAGHTPEVCLPLDDYRGTSLMRSSPPPMTTIGP